MRPLIHIVEPWKQTATTKYMEIHAKCWVWNYSLTGSTQSI